MSDEDTKPKTPQTLKSQIHEARQKLFDAEILEKGNEGLCGVYEALFGFLRQWIESKGNAAEKKAMEAVVSEYETTHIQKVYCSVGLKNGNTLYKYTIDRVESTLQEATDANAPAREKYLENITWGNLKSKRMNQYQKLWDIFKNMTDADEDVGNKNLTANKLRGNYNVRDD